jgi:S1-C subfamily serine protease
VLVAAVGAVAACVPAPPAGDRTLPAAGGVRAESVARAAQAATVRVRNRACQGLATGSGVVVADGTLVTNRHVLDGAGELEVSTWDGRTHRVRVASAATATDLAVVEVDGDLPPAMPVADDDPSPGENVTAVGYPLGSELAFADGQVVDYRPGEPYGEDGLVLRVSSQLRPGNSGGPLVDGDGRLVGVVFAVEPATDLGLAIPVSEILDLLAGVEAVREVGGDC